VDPALTIRAALRPPTSSRSVHPHLWAWVVLLCLLAGTAESQFLSRDFRQLWSNEVYENYGASGYRDYDFDEENRRFDYFGDLIIDGVDVVEYSEIRRDTPGLRGSYESRNARYDRFFDKLVIASEGFGPWSTRLIIGDHIRTHFTPMTLNLPRFNGIRWDGSSKKSRFTLLASHVTDPAVVPSGAGISGVYEERRIFGTSLVAGHWESQIGDLLRLGTSYVNTHRFDAEAGGDVNSMKGAVPQVMHGGLRRVFVFFTDDDPEDDAPGASVHELVMLVDDTPVEPVRVGKIENLLRHIPVTPDLTSSVLLKSNEISYLRQNRSWLKSVVEASNTPFFISIIDGATQAVSPATPGSPLTASGTDAVYYEYEIPDSAATASFEAILANDYSVDVVGAMRVPTLASGQNDLYYDWYNAARAEGQPGTNANLRRLRFQYGFPTGLTVLGMNFESRFLGVEIQGELARSVSHRQLPTVAGTRFDRRSTCLYVQARRPVHERAELGFEWFDVPHDYTTEFSVFRQSTVGPTVAGRLYQPFGLVEDNDDLDQWPDRLEHNDPLAPYGTSQGVGHGVFPGLDLDDDGVLDYNIDNGGGTDAYQPFLGYHAEPADLVYGDDFDNNGQADYRENDNLPDYAYPVDHKGLHGFLAVEPTGRTRLRAGHYRARQERRGTRSLTHYIDGEYRRDWPQMGYVRLNHRLKWLRDDIANTVYSFASYALDPDLLQNRDSVNSLTYLEWGVWAVSNLNLRNILSYNYIDLRGEDLDDPLFAKHGTITHLAVVNKADYTWQWRRLTVMPQLKHIYQRSKYPEATLPDRQRRWIMPILRVDCQVGPRTVLKLGAQGFPVLGETSKDPANPVRDFERSTQTAFIQNNSVYLGYDLTILMGMYRTKQTFTASSRPAYGSLEYFFRVLIG